MDKERDDEQKKLDAFLQIELQGRCVTISQFDETQPHLFKLEATGLGEKDPLRILLDMLPEVGTIEDYSPICAKYGARLFCDVYFEEESV